ncbi:MAG: molybdate ABC transporter substrate-binding protein [Chloroflexi bacterium]|nr:molybdate ABC transporter substrate-binding protein [Chloroflexota bacterium]
MLARDSLIQRLNQTRVALVAGCLQGAVLVLSSCGGTAPTMSTTPATAPTGVSASAGGSLSAKPASSLASASVGTDGVARIQGDLTVFAAASLTDAFNQMKSNVEGASAGSRVTLNFAGSQILRTQLSQGAKADLFASADTANMDGAKSDGSIEGQPTIFAHNKLVIVTPTSNAKVATVQDLAKPAMKVVIEQPSVPAGNYSRQALMKMSKDPAFGADFSDKVLANVVSQETDVKAVLSRIQLGEADAGLLYVSDAASAQPGSIKTVAIPDQFNVIADYPIAVVKGAPNPTAAKAFIDYLMTPGGGQAILQKSGLVPAVS